MWEKCPICKGTGLDPNYKVFNESPPKCPICNGKRIINKLTGKPPVDRKIGETTEIPSVFDVTYWGGIDRSKQWEHKEDFKKDSLSASDFIKLFYGTFKEDSGPR